MSGQVICPWHCPSYCLNSFYLLPWRKRVVGTVDCAREFWEVLFIFVVNFELFELSVDPNNQPQFKSPRCSLTCFMYVLLSIVSSQLHSCHLILPPFDPTDSRQLVFSRTTDHYNTRPADESICRRISNTCAGKKVQIKTMYKGDPQSSVRRQF